MSVELAYVVAAWLFLVGCWGMVTSRDLVRTVLSLAVAQTSTYVLLLAVGLRRGGTAPVYGDVDPGAPVVDPVVQALVFTDVVVGATVTALLLALAVQAQKRTGSRDPHDLARLRG